MKTDTNRIQYIFTTDHSPAYQVGQMCPLHDFLDEGLKLLQKLPLTHCWVPSSNVLTQVTIRHDTPPPQSRVQFCQGPTRHLKINYIYIDGKYFISNCIIILDTPPLPRLTHISLTSFCGTFANDDQGVHCFIHTECSIKF